MGRAKSLILIILTTAVGCGYDLTFLCNPGGPDCPKDQQCPTVPLGSGGCEDLPGVLDHAPIKVDAGRPIGCSAGLPYGNPFFGNSQQFCECIEGAPGDAASWQCPL